MPELAAAEAAQSATTWPSTGSGRDPWSRKAPALRGLGIGSGHISRSCYADPFGLNGELQRELGLMTTWRRS